MKNYGIELEFVVKDAAGNIVPAFKATTNLDGNPLIGELRTEIHNNIVDCVFELRKLIHNESKALKDKGYTLNLIPEIKVDDLFLKDLRRNENYTNRKQSTVLEDHSIYGKGTGKVLAKGIFKTSLQINISDNEEISIKEWKKIEIEDKSKWESSYSKQKYSQVFDFISVIRSLDTLFSKEIKDTKRVPGVYAIKDGQYGKRIEYRSLPANIDLDKLLTF